MSLTKRAIGGSIHRIREFELEKVNLIDQFDILQIVGEGWFGKILLTDHRSTQTEMVLKALPKAYTSITDFFREFHYGLHLSAHRNIITTYDVAFETAGFYVFSQEYAPLGDLTSNVTETGLGELHAKRVARQLAAAVHHIHSRELVHRDIKLDNILIFKSDFSRIKLCDFGETRKINTVVRRHNEWLPYSPPEVLQLDTDETYRALTAHDVWQYGIVVFVCLTGCLPWQKAASDDPRYTRYLNWHSATLNIAKKPKLFQLISSRAQRLFKRLLDPKMEKRPVSVLEVNKYVEDRWLAKLGAEKALNGGADERDELCPSMYSFHSSVEEKNQLLYTLTRYGIETTVDRSKKKDRIREWIQSSAIVEENEEESELEDFDEEGDENEQNMKGRHFPERRQSVGTTKKSRGISRDRIPRKNGSTTIQKARVDRTELLNKNNSLSIVSSKPIERKNPFAPQVAEERKIVAKFASFPNGDPSLAFQGNGLDSIVDTKLAGSQLLINKYKNEFSEQTVIHGKGYLFNNEQLKKAATDLSSSSDTRKETISHSQLNGAKVTVYNHEPSGTSSEASGSIRAPSLESSNSGPVVEEAIIENPVSRSPQAPIRKHRSQTAPFPAPVSHLDGSGIESIPARRSRSATVLPIVRRDQRSNGNPQPIQKQPTNNLTMSVASQLVMQSFNAMHTLNQTPKPMKPNYREKSSTREKPPLTYGKDAYEHYGIAQGAIAKSEIKRAGGSNSGSGSRSVSN
ncbi:putative serine/threonine-protein kinase YPL150W [Belonocnema kinseyi]|uniref:putative serine/threonine-protein kinase YPL150W n=1 Tax=Belonocnema kinseyi TaxID=2817044 RepID=UPI00143D8454|nr:putative serine/threonine-protein kinase YPL150W [Belonocnema kinseyi]XP_033208631.1 putative serine/threonine-protein kinase YPL150W [Belonocnema kinseyi]